MLADPHNQLPEVDQSVVTGEPASRTGSVYRRLWLLGHRQYSAFATGCRDRFELPARADHTGRADPIESLSGAVIRRRRRAQATCDTSRNRQITVGPFSCPCCPTTRRTTCDSSRLRPRSSLRIPRGYPALAELVQNGHRVNTEVSTDFGKRPTQTIKVDSLINLLSRQTTTTHRHIVTMENLADRPPLDTGPDTQLIHRLSTHIADNEFFNLIGAELACPARSGPSGGRSSGCGRVRQLPTQGLQRFYLAFRVVVTSPKIHVLIQVRTGIAPVLTCFICADPTFTPRFRPNVFIMLGDVWEGGCS
ncbi:hypothetical protein [Nocardia sp. NBC_00403]|uniref:hypothetical protein n=1 Tax=Nocardia sp. NBC_00403 TaxID=2975990 RepID=UPI002E1F652A